MVAAASCVLLLAATADAQDGLIAAYLLDGDATDGSSFGNDGIIHEGAVPGLDRFNRWDRAFRFSGFSTFIEVPSLPEPLDGDFTISFWEQTVATTRMHAIGLGNVYGDTLDVSINELPQAILAFWNGGRAYIWPPIPAGQLNDGAWHHVLLRREGTTVELFLDGEWVGSVQDSGTVGALGPLRIGRGSYDEGWFEGSLDDVLIYNRALDLIEIEALAQDRPAITIVSPSAGGRWQAATANDITWRVDQAATDVTIEVSSDSGATWQTVIESAAADQAYTWVTPQTSLALFRLRITARAGSEVIGVSEQTFWIVPGSTQPWRLVDGHGPFDPRDGVAPLEFNGYVWLLGGWNSHQTGSDVWRSRDGVEWEFVAKAPWSGRHAFGAVVHDGYMWVVGGDFNTDVWKSNDGVTWTLVLENAPWGGRYLPYVVAFQGKIWLMGGLQFFSGPYTPYNDVWNSIDGITWTRVVEHAPWSPRGIIHGRTILNGRIWIVGGGLYGAPPTWYPEVYTNDVWSSADGINWEQATSRAPWSPRIHHTAVAYAGRLWVMAGHDFHLYGGGAKNDVWTSADGVTWEELTGAPWSIRHATSVVVFRDTLWLIAGFLVNDIWQLQMPGPVTIGGGAAIAESTTVTLNLYAVTSDVTEMQFSNDGESWSSPQAYAAEASWTLTAGDGDKTVFVRFGNGQGSWSGAYSDTIFHSALPYLRLTSPVGGEGWQDGSQQTITWVSDSRVPMVRLEYSLDAGQTWTNIDTSVPAVSGQYSWTVPSVASSHARIRISDASNATLSDASAADVWLFSAVDGLVAHYPLSGDVDDATDNANNGTIIGATPTRDRFGTDNGAYEVGNGGVRVARLPTTLDDDFTVSYWAQSFDPDAMEPLGIGDLRGATLNFLFNGDPSGMAAYWNDSFANVIQSWEGPATLTDGGWHHVLLTRLDRVLTLYVDGVVVGSATYDGRIGTRGPLWLGRGTSGDAGWHGAIDSVRIYNRALAASEVLGLSQDRPSCSWSLSSTNAQFPSAGGIGTVDVVTTGECAWSAESNHSFITITAGATGLGSGTVVYAVRPGTLARSGSITIAGRTFNVSTTAAEDVSVRGAAYQSIRRRFGETGFAVYENADSGFNHGSATGVFGQASTTVDVNIGCVSNPWSSTGCSNNPNALDRVRGTVIRIAIGALAAGQSAGVRIEEPEQWTAGQSGAGFDLRGATTLTFDARSPNGAVVQFGVAGCTSAFMDVPAVWTTTTLALDALSCAPDLSNVHELIAVSTDASHAPAGAVVLLDNIRFNPRPAAYQATPAFPLATETFGVVPRSGDPIPPDQQWRNAATTHDSAMALLALAESVDPGDVSTLRRIADAFHYALAHDRAASPIPGTTGSARALRSAYSSGDVSYLNNQSAPRIGGAGEARLAGFTASAACPASGECTVLDGATAGDNAMAILALVRASQRLADRRYLDDANAIGRWIITALQDLSSAAGGYTHGFDPSWPAYTTLLGAKFVHDNATIYAAFSTLASAHDALGETTIAAEWTAAANAAGDFVIAMFDDSAGRFLAGTLPAGTASAPGICPGAALGDEILNVCDLFAANPTAVLGLARSPRYVASIDWRRPLQYVLDHAVRSIVAGGETFIGFAPQPLSDFGASGISWDLTGQMIAAMTLVDNLRDETQFVVPIAAHVQQLAHAVGSAPYGDGLGLVRSTLEQGERLALVDHCLRVGEQCTPQRVGLAASAWAIFGETGHNVFQYATSTMPIPLPALSRITVTGATHTKFTLTATINPNGSATIPRFGLGLTSPTDVFVVGAPLAADPLPQSVSTTISGLTCGALYRVQLTATNGGGTTQGAIETVSTVPCQQSLSRIALGVGPRQSDGGWLASPDQFDSSVSSATWVQLPLPTYNATGGGLRTAAGDVDGDGLDEIVAGVGPGGNGRLAVFDDAEHGFAFLRWIDVQWPSYNEVNGEVWPALGDIDGDGLAEIVLGLGTGGAGWIEILDDATNDYAHLAWRQVQWPDYIALGSGATHPAVGNVDGLGTDEIVVGLGTGSNGWLEVFSGADADYVHRSWVQVAWTNYNAANGMTFPAVGDLDDDGLDEIVVGLGAGSGGWLEVMDDAERGFGLVRWLRTSWVAYNLNGTGETHPAVGDIDEDRGAEIVIGLDRVPGWPGWFETLDDGDAGYSSLGWRYVERENFATTGVATFPAVGRFR